LFCRATPAPRGLIHERSHMYGFQDMEETLPESNESLGSGLRFDWP
jgi:hypothetical protein